MHWVRVLQASLRFIHRQTLSPMRLKRGGPLGVCLLGAPEGDSMHRA